MLWRVFLAVVEIARILARHVADRDAENSAAAKIFLKQMERADAQIAKALAARDRERSRMDTDGVRSPDRHSRD